MATDNGLLKRRAWVFGLACAALAVACVAAPDLIYGARPALVNVRWASRVGEPERRDLEARYRLTRPVFREGSTWAYYLADPSRRNVRALVTDPGVEDTHYINRLRFTIWREASRDPYRGPGARVLPGLLGVLAWLLGLSAVGFALTTVPRVARAAPAWLGRGHTVAHRLAAAWAPVGSARSVGAFRVVFGAALLAMVLHQPINEKLAVLVASSAAPVDRLGFGWVWRALEAQPVLATWGQAALVVGLVAFIAGVCARASYVASYCGLWLWVLLHTVRGNAHPYSAMLVGSTALLFAPWGDAWSVDAWWRRRAGRGPSARALAEYGYVHWIPGVVLGVCFLAAAWAKLRDAGLAWITNGTVKYHFLTDSPGAVVDWGLELGQYPGLAIAASAAAVIVEAVVIVGALATDYRLRAASGVAAVAILSGFLLFQGLFWPGWWVLALSFLPWHVFDGTRAAAVAPRRWSALRVAQVTVLVALFVEQLLVSVFRLEKPPALSVYDMYSTTYGSPSDYEEASQSYWLVARQEGVPDRSCEVSRTAAEAWTDEDRRGDWEGTRAAVACFGDGPGSQLLVEARRARVDWTRWRLAGEDHRVLAGPFPWKPGTSRNGP